MKPKLAKRFSYPYIVWMVLFTVIPLFIIGYYGFTTQEGTLTFDNVSRILEPVNLKALLLSLKLAVISTAFCLILAFPLAMIIRKLKVKNTGFVIFVFILPMWMNFLLRTFAWQSLLENTGVINSILRHFGFEGFHMINTQGAILLGMVYDFLPFMLLPIYNALVKVEEDTLNAARDLGANEFQVLTKITIPLTMPGIVSGITMVFVPALTSFVISDMLGGGKILLIGNIIEEDFASSGIWNAGSGLSLVLMAIVLGSMAIMNRYDRGGEGAAMW